MHRHKLYPIKKEKTSKKLKFFPRFQAVACFYRQIYPKADRDFPLYGTYGLKIVNGNTSVGAIRNLSFDASRNNITYGKSSTVQAAAVQILIIIKV